MSAPAPTAFTQRLGALLQRRRQRLGLTQAQLAEGAALSLKYVGEVERGEANVTVQALERLAVVLGWDPWSLFATSTPPISAQVHTLLLQEIEAAKSRLQVAWDWLTALDPSRRELREPTEEDPDITCSILQTPRRGRPPNRPAGGVS